MPDITFFGSRCVVCGGGALDPVVQKGGQRYCECAACGHICVDPLPALEQQAEFYRRQYDEGQYRSYLDARPLKLRTFERRLEAIVSVLPRPGKVLDLGCASGAFVEVARRRGIEAWGAEAVAAAVEAAPDAVRQFLLVKDVERESVEGQYDLVTFFDVIEHMRDPRLFIERVRRMLLPRGAIALTCPDRGHYLRTLMGARWPHYQPFQHFHLFGRTDLRRFLEAAGFEVVAEGPVGKVLTYDYLSQQLQANNPLLSRLLRSAGRVAPESLRNAPVEIRIGEMMMIAKMRSPSEVSSAG